MLNKLFGSELRAKVLEKILAAPEVKYYSRALSRELKLMLSSLNRELENLEKLGLIIFMNDERPEENKYKEKKFFIVNQHFLLFEELKALFSKAQLFAIQEFLIRLEKVANLKYFVLSGQFSDNPLATTDMLIVGRVRRDKFLLLLADLEKKLRREVNFTIMEEKEFYYRREVVDIFLYTILNNKKVVIIDKLETPKSKVKKTEEN